MSEPDLYLCVVPLRMEPLVKVGVTHWPDGRWKGLGDDLLDASRAFLLRGENPALVRALETTLLLAFDEYRQPPVVQLSSGNTEVFRLGVYFRILSFLVPLVAECAWVVMERCPALEDLEPLAQATYDETLEVDVLPDDPDCPF